MDWQHGGLGTIVDIVTMYEGRSYRIMWHVDIEDIKGYKGIWYTRADFENGTIVKV